METLKFGVFGAGFWSNYQVAGWNEIEGVELVAICDPDYEKAKLMAKKFEIPSVYSSAEKLLNHESLDFVDIITNVETHLPLAKLAASAGIHVVCQKPMAPSHKECLEMHRCCQDHGVDLYINENFRWQAPIRKVKHLMDSGQIGEVFKGRVTFCSAFPVFENQPFLKQLDRFILTDIGSHILDICRFLFGEVDNLRCLTKRVNKEIKGEDVATVLMEMENGIHCYAEMSYASRLAKEVFPETLLLVEGEKGSIELAADLTVHVTTKEGTTSQQVIPEPYHWVDPDYALIHSSIVDTQRDLLRGLRGGTAETTGEDNLKTSQLVWACYQSAENKELITLKDFSPYENT